MKSIQLLLLAALAVASTACASDTPALQAAKRHSKVTIANTPVREAANRTEAYLPYLKGKNIAMVVNQTSVIGKNLVPLPDSLLKLGVQIKKVFGPEHGFRGDASNGASVSNSVDAKTGLPVVSLYGNKHYKPTAEDLQGIDLVIFDIQDVGARFYTYISTLAYVMEACAEQHVEVMILDRPNPNGYYVDGPVLDTVYHSFVGMHPIPVTHGMTMAEYAQMINGQGWLKNGVQCKLKIIKVENYTHHTFYKLPVNPSPNLNTQNSIMLYPSLCLFEGTTLSLGRGTMFPFQVVGHPSLKSQYSFSFTPVSLPGMSENPPLKGQTCYGIDFRKNNAQLNEAAYPAKLNLKLLMDVYKAFPDKGHFFNAYFTKLAGNTTLQKQIEAGKTEAEIRQSWEPGLSKFKVIRKKYLLYQ